MPHLFLSDRDIKDRAQLGVLARPVNSHDLLNLELRLELIILARLDQIEKQLNMTRDEALAAIAGLKNTITDIGTEVTKVGTETDTLNQKIVDLTTALNNGGAVPPEIATALADVQTAAGNVKAGIQAVDDKVPDMIAPAPTAINGVGDVAPAPTAQPQP